MEMNYRVIVRFSITKEVNEQYFVTFGESESLAQYFNCALENGASLGYVIQERKPNGEILTVNENGDSIGKWVGLSWDA